MNLKPLEVVGILGIVYMILKKIEVTFAEKLSFVSVKAKIEKLLPDGVYILLKITIRNNNSISITLNRFDGVLVYGEYQMAQVLISNAVLIGAKSNVEIPVTVYLPFVQSFGNVADMITKGTWWQTFRIIGKVSAYNMNFNIDVPLQIL
jgi:LEA14-like dessication related protein